MTKWLKDFIDSVNSAFATGATIATITNILLDFMDLLFPYAELLQLVVEAAGTIFGIGHAALSAAFTSTEYDLLSCIFFCNADGNGVVDAAALAQIESDITDQLNTTAALVTNAILFMQGEIGLSNAGAIGTETGDCSACACAWTYTWDFTVSASGWHFVDYGGDTGGTWVSGQGFEVVANGGNSYGAIYEATQTSDYTFDIPAGAKITEMTIYTEHDGNSDGAHLEFWIGADRSAGLSRPMHYYSNHWFATQDLTGEIDADTGQVVAWGVFWIGAIYHIEKFVVRGTGTPPAFEGGTLS
jgi:hypothetical protein